MELRCPGCGGEVESDLTCHTYPQRRADGTEQWMACMPCDSATMWSCARRWDDDGSGCDWHWVEGLNPRNPRAAENEEKNPHWEE